jgi:hypothetical protein
MKVIKFTLVLLLLSTHLFAEYDPSHKLFTQILKANVNSGVVNYEGLTGDSVKLSNYLKQIESVSRDQYLSFKKPEQMAYLINAYNAFTLKLISDFYPVNSIRDIGGMVGGNLFNRNSKQWKISEYEVKGQKVTFTAMGKSVTLDEIEHENLRPLFKDARVHFALVCGAVSCPFLRSEAYTGGLLAAQLDNQGEQFLSDSFRNRYNEMENRLYLSKIFDWFSDDFKRDKGNVKDFIKTYLPKSIQSKIGEETSIGYLDYDWSLNNKAGKLN